ncbi:Protein of unknown function, partial [Gryllus bimaculatus]
MSDNEGGDLQLLVESVACVRTALNEILLCHEQALNALENLEGNVRAVELLLEYGADTSIKNVKGTTALDVASTPQIQRLLRNA